MPGSADSNAPPSSAPDPGRYVTGCGLPAGPAAPSSRAANPRRTARNGSRVASRRRAARVGDGMATDRPLAVVILAAGQGKRMQSGLAKVLHELCGRPMLSYPIEVARGLEPERLVVVIGRDAEKVRESFDGAAEFVLQAE